MKLLFLHGIDQAGKSSEILRERWLEALNLGLSKSHLPGLDKRDVIIPFYGDALAKIDPDRQKRSSKSKRLDVDFEKFAFEFGTEALEDAAPISHLRSDMELSDDKKRRDIQNSSVVIGITKLLDHNFPKISSAFIQRFLKEVHSYLCDETIQKSVHRIVSKSIASTDDEVIVVSHSLGSIVAYDLLGSGDKIHASQLVTLGSPLAINAVKARLSKKPHKPPCISAWLNGFDAKDIVALNPLNKRHFAQTEPPIKNHSKIRNFTENHHSIDGYLADAKVAKFIHQALKKS